MRTKLTFRSDRFQPTPDELDEESDEYINPGVFAKELYEFLSEELSRRGHRVRVASIEDWGWYAEVYHSGRFRMSFGCSNLDGGHLVQVQPDTPTVRRLFRRIDVQAEVEAFVADTRAILLRADGISNVSYLDG